MKTSDYGDADYFLLLGLQPIATETMWPGTVWDKGQEYAYLIHPYDLYKLSDPNDTASGDRGMRIPPNIFIPVNCDFIDVPAQQYLASRANANWGTGDFSHSFEALEGATKALDNVSLADVSAFLAAQLAQSKKDVELLGVKIPTELISRWGLVLIVCVQFYYWLNLRQLASQLEGSPQPVSEPWIGIYPDAWARIAFRSSSAILPFLAIYLVVWTGLTADGALTVGPKLFSRGIEGAIAFCGLALAVGTWKICDRIARSPGLS